MKFTVTNSRLTIIRSKELDEGFLLSNSWNDWYKYETLYTLFYRDKSGVKHEIGGVKIGQFNMEGRRPGLLPNFPRLSKKSFFSVGQDDNYYERLNNLGDKVRDRILAALCDFAKDLDLFELAKEQDVTSESLLRFVSETTVRGQFKRLANGGARLSAYEFRYQSPGPSKDRMTLDFKVTPESNPPSNIHVLIGTNGVGKTFLMYDMIQSLVGEKTSSTKAGKFKFKDVPDSNRFANLIYVSFSAFDVFPLLNESSSIRFVYAGLKRTYSQPHPKSTEELANEFANSLINCAVGAKRQRWEKAIQVLETDALFMEKNVVKLLDPISEEDLTIEKIKAYKAVTAPLFTSLSSGHKIILLTITRLVETVEEKSLILLDEPEGHLHPPLLSAFIRALSDLLINRNAVAIVATHSPVVLQEVPRSCVWRLRRTGSILNADRLEVESFGENVGILTHEAFGLEVTNSGFHKMLREAVNKEDSDYETIAQSQFNDELGMEARALLKSLLLVKKNRRAKKGG